ncbi:uncharacterized protein LOC141638902 [Silene latifolia]|uniref:uncharacterized protein LOC141638902 n=1 Tax=Silene latifolia TaxID=37657 RepID=UPI003D76C91E
MWDPHAVEVDVCDVTSQSIHAKIYDKARQKRFWYTVVYGMNRNIEREQLWSSIRHYHQGIRGPWIICGDFNAILSRGERIGGAEVTNAEIQPLLQMVQDCNLDDLKAKGSYYTWNNKHEAGSRVYSRIDRALCNADWIDSFPGSFVHFLREGLFDHCPCLVRITLKLKKLKGSFKQLNRDQFGDIENLTHVTELALFHFQELLVYHPLNEELCAAEKACVEELGVLTKARDLFLRQKAKYQSSIFFNGIDEHLISEVELATGMKRGKVPFKYLGVNVSPKRLSVMECTCLVEIIVDRIRSLGARKLSYAGRLVLIKSVLSSLHSYWARIFILPKTIIARIEVCYRSFLWHGNEQKENPPLVAWDTICQPKRQGGLGIKRFHEWNVAAIGKYAWWVQVKADHLRNGTWKDYNPTASTSWAWRKICQVKNTFKQHMFESAWILTNTPYTVGLGYKWLVPVADQEETHEHLLFMCEYSSRCLHLVRNWCKLPLPDRDCID